MIAFKVLTATGTTTNIFNEADIGGSGGQPDWNGYRLDATSADITINLPKISTCEGKILTFVTTNPSLRTITINPASGDQIVISFAAVSSISATVNLSHVTMCCNGSFWFALSNGNTFA